MLIKLIDIKLFMRIIIKINRLLNEIKYYMLVLNIDSVPNYDQMLRLLNIIRLMILL